MKIKGCKEVADYLCENPGLINCVYLNCVTRKVFITIIKQRDPDIINLRGFCEFESMLPLNKRIKITAIQALELWLYLKNDQNNVLLAYKIINKKKGN